MSIGAREKIAVPVQIATGQSCDWALHSTNAATVAYKALSIISIWINDRGRVKPFRRQVLSVLS